MSARDTKLTVLSGADQGVEVPLTDAPVLLGRGRDCDLALHDSYASRHHCWIEPREEEWWVRDLGSKNGTCVAGEIIDHERRLLDGDTITVGRTDIRFSDPGATKSFTSVPAREPGRVSVDVARRAVSVDGVLVEPPLSPKQWLLLTLLWERAGEPLSKDAIAAAVWPDAEGAIYDYQIDKLVSRLRARLGDTGEELIQTVWGYGYKLDG